MKDIIRPNPKMLKWARESLGYSLEEVVKQLEKKRIKITVQKFDNLEKGIDVLSYSQLEKLAYDIYKRPLAVFFFQNLPMRVI